jgi:hypothetical protein
VKVGFSLLPDTESRTCDGEARGSGRVIGISFSEVEVARDEGGDGVVKIQQGPQHRLLLPVVGARGKIHIDDVEAGSRSTGLDLRSEEEGLKPAFSCRGEGGSRNLEAPGIFRSHQDESAGSTLTEVVMVDEVGGKLLPKRGGVMRTKPGFLKTDQLWAVVNCFK